MTMKRKDKFYILQISKIDGDEDAYNFFHLKTETMQYKRMVISQYS